VIASRSVDSGDVGARLLIRTEGINARNVSVDGNILSFGIRDANVSAPSRTSTPPELSELGSFVDATSVTTEAYLNVSLAYTPDGSVDPSTVGVWRNDGSGWSRISGSTADGTVASANVTSFTTLAALGELPAPNVSVTIDGTNSPVVEGSDLNVTVTATNTGGQGASQTVNLTIDGTVRDDEAVSLAPGENRTFNLTWATGAGDDGTYTATASSANNSASTGVEVLAPANFSVAIDASNSPVVEGETLSVTANVTNTGDVAATQSVTLSDTGFDNTQRDTADVTLAGGASNESVVLNWTTSPGDAGTGDVTVAGNDDTDSREVTVQEPAAFAVEIIGTTSPVVAGDTLSVTATVTNTGDAETTQTITLIDTGFTDTEQDAAEVTLAGGASESVSLSWVPDDTGAGSVTVASDDDSAATTVTVQEPAAFELSAAVPAEPVLRSETMTVEATATNVGDVAGSGTITVKVDGTEVGTTDVALQAGASETVTVEWDTSDVTLPVETDDWNRGRGSDREDAKDVEIDVVVSMGDEVVTTTAAVECLDPGELSRDDPQTALCDDDHDGRDGGSTGGTEDEDVDEGDDGSVDESDDGSVDSERDHLSSRVARSAP